VSRASSAAATSSFALTDEPSLSPVPRNALWTLSEVSDCRCPILIGHASLLLVIAIVIGC
jgi:hypothetical protein